MKKPRTPAVGRFPGVRRAKDPHREREAARYEAPIPSREFILESLAEAGVPLEDAELAHAIGIRSAEFEAFRRRLGAMEREGQILRNRKGAILVARKVDLIAGRVEGHPDGFGFVVPDEGEDDFYLNAREMRKVLHGDRVMLRQSGLDRRGRREGSIVEVIARGNNRVVGRLHREGAFSFVTASNRCITQDVLVEPEGAGSAKPGQVVTVELTRQPSVDARDLYVQPMGRVVEVLGKATDPGVEIEIALRKHELPYEFSAPARDQAARYPARLREADLKARVDLRDLPLVTIDGETAKDFDDAVFCEQIRTNPRPGKAGARPGNEFRLVVAIADVSHYVRHGDALDLASRERGNSVYFPRRVIPMLPERLSNGLCSINPNVDRLCMVCDMRVTASGRISGYRFYPAVMRSRARLTYTQVAHALAAGNSVSAVATELQSLLPQLQMLHAVYERLAQARVRRGAIDFETLETAFVFDDKGRLANIVPVQRNDAHRVIEECMLAANVCASDFLQGNEHPVLYRIHEGPTPEKLAAVRDFLKGFGLDLGGGDEPRAKDYARLLESVKNRPDVQLLQTVLLRSLRQAVYSPENVGHFGLAYEHYTHFTSPIRRYPDLLIHRAIKAVLEGGRYRPGNWVELGRHCSETERRADEATREVGAWLKCYYMKERVGEEFEGSISAVTGFGIFVALDGVYVEGLVHISELGGDYFRFDAARHELRGERMNKRYRLADRIRVRIARVDLEMARMDFVLAT
ncbi:MAG: ribonuclease R [Betaproteobacteria bacterium RIFCSPLOWO2_12_FULL_63_13]|nr:MAG: ribonuclease R [Betaproteobacteria bacterium RIFCSPLOWO2_02_FULL_63_19]OGA45320.1 MAG: ribonuclease R [Betaproteobacteria bacterium RIFCSPLOWO2_12_FULL_63_13]